MLSSPQPRSGAFLCEMGIENSTFSWCKEKKEVLLFCCPKKSLFKKGTKEYLRASNLESGET